MSYWILRAIVLLAVFTIPHLLGGRPRRPRPCSLRASRPIVVRRSPTRPNYVAVVASNPQTVDELCSYLKGAGVASSGTRTVRAVVPPAATAVVVFPDDFQHDEVEEAIVSLRRARPKLLIVLVTAAPQHLRAA